MEVRELKMSEEFTKFHLDLSKEGWEYYQPLLHHFTGADKGGPHDHPFDLTIHVLKGSYKERVYKVNFNGTWNSLDTVRSAGHVFNIKATHIHQIIELPEGECWTIALPGDGNRKWGFWNFSEPIAKFTPFKNKENDKQNN